MTRLLLKSLRNKIKIPSVCCYARVPEWEEVITVPLHCSGGVSALDMVDVLVESKGDVNTKDLEY